MSLIEAIMLGTSVVTIGVELGSNSAKEVSCELYVITSGTGSTPARVDSDTRDVTWDPSTDPVSVAGDTPMTDDASSSKDDPNVLDTVSWDKGETVDAVAIWTLPVLRTLLALEPTDIVIWPWVGSISSETFESLGLDRVSEVTLGGTEIVLDADTACSVVCSLDEVVVLDASASEIDCEVGILPSTLVWLGEVVALMEDVGSCTSLLLTIVVNRVLLALLTASTDCGVGSTLGCWTGGSLDRETVLGNNWLENWLRTLGGVAMGDAGLTLRGKVLVNSGRVDVESSWVKESLAPSIVAESWTFEGGSDKLGTSALGRGLSKLEETPVVIIGSDWAVGVSAAYVDEPRALMYDAPVGSSIVAPDVTREPPIEKYSWVGIAADSLKKVAGRTLLAVIPSIVCDALSKNELAIDPAEIVGDSTLTLADPYEDEDAELSTLGTSDSGSNKTLEDNERLITVPDWGLEEAFAV
jgi:hypothetical protein